MARKAKATAILLEQVNELAPNRSKSSDGWIGDTAHQGRKSEHNANSKGVVRALDITHDPAGGLDSYRLAETWRLARDERTLWIISNRKIASGPTGPKPFEWRPYSGKNPHDQHCHISVGRDPGEPGYSNGSDAKYYDDDTPWVLDGSGVGVPDVEAPRKTLPVLRIKSKGDYVRMVQMALGGKTVDGIFGKMTDQAVRQFQRDHGLDDDGIVGPYTWRELLRPWGQEVRLVFPDPWAKLNEVALAAQKLGAAGTVEEIAGVFAALLTDVLPEKPLPVPEPTPEPEPEPEPEPLPEPAEKEYHALVSGGFFSSDPDDLHVPTSIRTNNPGALNTTKYIATLPGYAGSQDFAGKGNHTAIFYAPEYGVLAYWDLLRRYREAGATTIRAIIARYGGGQDYSEYINFVTKSTGLPSTYQIRIDGSDDNNLAKFAKAMWRYEAGRETPLNELQIKTGFGLGREHARMT